MKINYTSIITIVGFLVSFNVNAQLVIFDGDNCNPPNGDEWGIPDVVDGDDVPADTADITNFWFDQDNQYIYMAFERLATGNSSFSFFLNTDCNNSTGDLTKDGSDLAIFFAISPGSNPTITDNTLFVWNGSMFVDTGVTFDAFLGKENCTGSEGLFFEFRVLISDIITLCDTTSTCNSITMEIGSSLAGGSPNSALKDTFDIPFTLGINSIPTAIFNQSDVCAGATTMFDGTSSTFFDNNTYTAINAPDFGDSITLYEWDFDYDGSIFTTNATGSTTSFNYTTAGTYTAALRVTDSYGCTDIETQTFTVFEAPQPIYTYTPDGSCGFTVDFNASSSIDPTGGNDLTYEWDFDYDGNTFTVDASGIMPQNTFSGCATYSVALRVTDPTTPAPCDAVIAFQDIMITDLVNPTFTVPNNVTITCTDDILDLMLTGDVTDEADNCSSGLEATFTDDTSGLSSCNGTGDVLRTWELTDSCGNTTQQVQTITIEDTTAPVFVETLPIDTTISCDAVPTAVVLTANDNCDASVSVNYTETITGQDDACA
ncbi:PKD domain-containing protein, partial [Aquimarina rhabdastrellae]